MSNLSLRPRDNIFAIDIELIFNYSNNWNELVQKNDVNKNLKHFKRIIDFNSCDINRMYYVGSDSTVKLLKSILSDNSLHELPTKINNDSLNDFSRIIKNNYSKIYDNPTKSKKDAIKLLTFKQLTQELDMSSKKPKNYDWSVAFLAKNIDKDTIVDKENDYFNDFRQDCYNRSVPIFDIDKLESEFSKFADRSDSLRKNQHVYPEDFFKPMSSPSNFFIVYDRYLYSWGTKKLTKKLDDKSHIETLFGCINKKDIKVLLKEDNHYKSQCKSFQNDGTYVLKDDGTYILKEAFNDITMRLSLYLKAIDSFDKKPKHCFLLGSSKGGNTKSFERYINTLEKRILEISNSEEKEENHELENLELILSFKDSIKMVPYGVVGPKTNCGHNRLIFNDHSLIEWGEGQAAFRNRSFLSKYWISTGDQSVASYSIFNERYKKLYDEDETKKRKKVGEYKNNLERLAYFCDDFENTIIPKATV